MLILLLFVFLIQIFTFWIFEPLTSFVEYFLEIRSLHIFALLALFLLFSGKKVENN